MLSPFLSVLFSLYLVIMFFKEIGMWCFGGVVRYYHIEEIINDGGNGLYYLLNFNDALSGMLTLFAVMAGNNWNSFTDMYCALVGNNWPRLYFSLFYMTTIMIMLNIVISFVLEIYSVSLEDSRTKTDRI